MPKPADEHFRLVDQERSLERLRQAIDVLEKSKVPYIVEGGWAVAAYDSPVPSVDLDILHDGDLDPSVPDLIEAATGVQIYTMAAQDQLGIDFTDARQPNYLVGKDLAYVPHDLLSGNVVRRGVQLVQDLSLPVPKAPQLAFMKLKAFHDRSLQWSARRETYLLGSMTEGQRKQTLLKDESYWLRKAGKDLFDIAVLLKRASPASVVSATPAALRTPLLESLRNVPLPIQAFAEDMAERNGLKWTLPKLA